MPAACGLLGHDLAGLALGADEEHRPAVAGELAQVLGRLLVHDQGLLEVDDVDLVAMAVDVRGHLGVPEARLVAEVHTGFKHFPHGDGHDDGSLQGLDLTPAGRDSRPTTSRNDPCRNPSYRPAQSCAGNLYRILDAGHPLKRPAASRRRADGLRLRSGRVRSGTHARTLPARDPLTDGHPMNVLGGSPMQVTDSEAYNLNMPITIKTSDDIEAMRTAGRLASEVLDFITPHVRPGISAGELDRLCHDYMVQVQGTIPAPLNYAPPGYRPFPKSICTSVNHQVCHGIPGDKVLKSGDVVNIDVTVIKDGYHGDTSRMFFIGEPSIAARRLCEITYECMWLGIDQVRPGATIGDIGHVIQRHAEAAGFSIVREFCGHGIGRKFHEDPQILHYGRPGTGDRLEPGMTFTIEPMVNAGRRGDP
jgi:methionyl aminopeptidase